MTSPTIHPLRLPDHWTPEQALAAYEMIELIRCHLCARYGIDIHDAMLEERRTDIPDPCDFDPSDCPF